MTTVPIDAIPRCFSYETTICHRSWIHPVRCSQVPIRIEPSRDCHDDVDQHAETTFEIVGFAVAQEVANHKDCKHQQYDHENFEIQVHLFIQPPTNNDGKRCVEKGSLDGRAQAMEESKVDLIVPGYRQG